MPRQTLPVALPFLKVLLHRPVADPGRKTVDPGRGEAGSYDLHGAVVRGVGGDFSITPLTGRGGKALRSTCGDEDSRVIRVGTVKTRRKQDAREGVGPPYSLISQGARASLPG